MFTAFVCASQLKLAEKLRLVSNRNNIQSERVEVIESCLALYNSLGARTVAFSLLQMIRVLSRSVLSSSNGSAL